MEEEVKNILEVIRPFLQRDGGDVEFVELTPDNVVRVRLQGHCKGCPSADLTIKNGIESIIREQLPSIQAVEAVEENEI